MKVKKTPPPPPPPMYVVAVDPGSREMGVALINADGTIDAAFTLYSDKTAWGARLEEIVRQLPLIIGREDRARVTDFTCEVVMNGPLVAISATLLHLFPNANFSTRHRVVPSQWKSFARKHGADKEPLKGLVTLRQVAKTLKIQVPEGIDENGADACLIGLFFWDLNKAG